MVARLSLGFALLAGCATTTTPTAATPVAPREVGREGSGGVRIVDARYGREHSARSEEMVMPFGPNQNGNELVAAALERAAERGASYVADLAITMTFRWGGLPIECRTPVRFESDVPAGGATVAPAPVLPASAGGAAQYGTDIEKYRPAKEGFVAEDRELSCAGARLERCGWRDVTRNAERYDYETKVGFVPPNWPHLAERFAAGRLVPAEPSCYTIEEAEVRKASPYRLTAVAYHVSEQNADAGESRSQLPRRDAPRSIVPETTQRKLDRSPDKSRTRRDPLEVERDSPR